jgi:hypothetical protein
VSPVVHRKVDYHTILIWCDDMQVIHLWFHFSIISPIYIYYGIYGFPGVHFSAMSSRLLKKKFLIFSFSLYFFKCVEKSRRWSTCDYLFFLGERSRVCVCQMSSRQSQDRVKIINRNGVRVRGTGGQKAHNFFFFFSEELFPFCAPSFFPPSTAYTHWYIYIYIYSKQSS